MLLQKLGGEKRRLSSGSQTNVTEPEHALSTSFSRTPEASLNLSSVVSFKPLTQSLEVQALNFFLSAYVFLQRDPQTLRGYLEVLPRLYTEAMLDSPLSLATSAVSLAVFGQFPGRPAARHLSGSFYSRALIATGKAVNDSDDSRQDETLMAVLLLGFFEELTATFGMSSVHRNNAHAEGAESLVHHRGSANFRDEISKQLLIAVRSQSVANAVFSESRLGQHAATWPEISGVMPQNAATQLDSVLAEVAMLRASLKDIQGGKDPGSQEDILMLYNFATNVDAKLLAWSIELPPSWQPIPASFIPLSVRDAGVYEGKCAIYTDIFVASVWNKYRSARIVVQTILLKLENKLSSSLPLKSNLDAAKSVLQDLADDVCASLPYHLGSKTTIEFLEEPLIEYPTIEGLPPTKEYRAAANALGGWLLLGPLSGVIRTARELAQQEKVDVLSEGQILWMIGQMSRIYRLYNIKET